MRRLAAKCMLMTTLAVICSSAAIAGPFAHGVRGGTIGGPFYSSGYHGIVCAITVPDSFVVLDVKFARDRVIVAACVEHERANSDPLITSELWHFAPRDSNATVVTYADRTVLCSAKSSGGESHKVFAYSVNGFRATAVFEAGSEWGSVLLFDRRGQSMPLDRSKIARACNCRPDLVVPLAWIERGREEYLVLHIAEFEGIDGTYVEYSAADGSIAAIKPEDLSGAVMGKLLIGIIGQK